MNKNEDSSARQLKIRQLLISLFAGLLLALTVLYTWKMNYDALEQTYTEKASEDIILIAEELREAVSGQIQLLDNMGKRIAETDGDYLSYLEFEAEIAFEQISSVRFIKRVSSDLSSTDLFQADELDFNFNGEILENDHLRATWNRARSDSALTISHWLDSGIGTDLFFVHTPLYYEGDFQGTLTYGIDFTELFNTALTDKVEYRITLMDEAGTIFYKHGDERSTDEEYNFRDIQVQVPPESGNYWYLTGTSKSPFVEAILKDSLFIILAMGIVLTFLFTLLFYLLLRHLSVRKSGRNLGQKLLAIMDSSPHAIYVVNNKGIVTGIWNQAAENILGWSAKEVYNQYLPHVTKESPVEYQEMIESVLNGETYRNRESTRLTREGTKLHVRLNADQLKGLKNGSGEVIVLLEDITGQRKTEQELKNEKQFADTTLKGLPGHFYLIDKKRRLIRWNSNVNRFFGMTDDELKKITFLDLIVEDERLKVLEALQNASVTDKLEIETVVRSRGKLHDFFINGTQMKIGRERYIAINGMNITERNSIRNELIKSVEEKDVLLSEIHHRVKNNLAIIANLIDIQLIDSEDEKLIDVLKETQNRIYSIAGVHEMLYDVKNFSKIQFREYLNNLFEQIFRLYNDKHQMTGFDLKVEVEYLNINQAIPLGLMLAELITNTFKHAFVQDKAGTISIEITGAPNQITIVYRDNGNGLNPEIFDRSTSMGLTLIRSLLNQLEATYSVNGKEGFELEFTFSEQMKGSHSNL